MVSPLHAVLQIELHVVTQVVEAELVVGAVGNVGRISLTTLIVIEIVHDYAHRQAKEGIKLSHPLRVAFSEVVVDGDDVNTFSGKRIQIYREGGNQGFAFASLHFGDLALVQHRAADQLDVEMAHIQHAPPGFADYGKGLRKDFVQRFFEHRIELCFAGSGRDRLIIYVVGRGALDGLANTLTQFLGFGPKLGIRELLHLGLKQVNLRNNGPQALHLALVLSPDDFGDDDSDQKLCSFGPLGRGGDINSLH